MTTFKSVILGIFAVSIVIGVGLFATSKGGTALTANLTVWGTLPTQVFESAYKASSIAKNSELKVSYVQKNINTFDQDFIEALADGVGPDIVLLREDFVYKHKNRIITIPYSSYPERDFKDIFIEGGEVYKTPFGITAVPFVVDPIVMYWNRDLFNNNTIVQPPKNWDEIGGIVSKITRRDSNANVIQSAIALGEYKNIVNAKDIFSMLLLQSGTPITAETNNGFEIVLNDQFGQPVVPSQSTMNFYTQFANPTSAMYSWNRSLPSSLNMFLAGNLGIYLGFASEIQSIQQKNSNLNFDVALVPQIRNTPRKTTFGHIYGLSIVKQTMQAPAAFVVINALTENTALSAVEMVTSLPPVRRDLLSIQQTQSYRDVFYTSAIFAKSFIDPDTVSTANSYRDAIESVTSGRSRVTDALNKIELEMQTQI